MSPLSDTALPRFKGRWKTLWQSGFYGIAANDNLEGWIDRIYGEASADRADPFENMRMGLYQVRAGQQRAAAMQAYEVLRLHTLGSAEVLGIDTQVGSLKVGKRADMLLLDPRAFTPWQEPYAALVFAAGVKDIREVFVDGVSLAR